MKKVILAMLIAAMAGVLSLFSICITEYVKTFFSVVTFPFLFVMIESLFTADDNKIGWTLCYMLSPMQVCVIPPNNFLLFIVLGTGISVLIIKNRAVGKDFL